MTLIPAESESIPTGDGGSYKNLALAWVFFTVSTGSLSNNGNMAITFKDALAHLENKRVKSTRPLIPPQILQEDLPLYVFHPAEMS